MSVKASFFGTPSEFRNWLEANHNKAEELFVGFYKVATGKPSMTWDESVDEAMCFGWIDGVRKRIDKESYQIRFSQRRVDSYWSKKNIARAQRLIKEGRMQDSGLKAFVGHKGEKSGVSSSEQNKVPKLSEEHRKTFQANKAALEFFLAQPPGYRHTLAHWVMSAKQQATQQRRLARLIEVSAEERRVDLMAPFGKKTST